MYQLVQVFSSIEWIDLGTKTNHRAWNLYSYILNKLPEKPLIRQLRTPNSVKREKQSKHRLLQKLEAGSVAILIRTSPMTTSTCILLKPKSLSELQTLPKNRLI